MKIKIVDLFAGIGGIRRGFENAIGKKILNALCHLNGINML